MARARGRLRRCCFVHQRYCSLTSASAFEAATGGVTPMAWRIPTAAAAACSSVRWTGFASDFKKGLPQRRFLNPRV
ncbi:Magnesium transporter CorA-like family protein [Zea mays]|uniref:Magnesium transporter CorA-like family protein n=1 Tax=Zea mays TaxID=4577 RepID=A0A1D6G0Y1_MAIZE|nr:Magnesium transporter CorA-like family protein [Zea mays]